MQAGRKPVKRLRSIGPSNETATVEPDIYRCRNCGCDVDPDADSCTDCDSRNLRPVFH